MSGLAPNKAEAIVLMKLGQLALKQALDMLLRFERGQWLTPEEQLANAAAIIEAADCVKPEAAE